MNAQSVPYSGPVEAYTLDEAAFRCRVTAEHFKNTYTGKRVRIGGSVRVAAHHLAEWLDSLAESKTVAANEWDELDASDSGLPERQAGEAA